MVHAVAGRGGQRDVADDQQICRASDSVPCRRRSRRRTPSGSRQEPDGDLADAAGVGSVLRLRDRATGPRRPVGQCHRPSVAPSRPPSLPTPHTPTDGPRRLKTNACARCSNSVARRRAWTSSHVAPFSPREFRRRARPRAARSPRRGRRSRRQSAGCRSPALHEVAVLLLVVGRSSRPSAGRSGERRRPQRPQRLLPPAGATARRGGPDEGVEFFGGETADVLRGGGEDARDLSSTSAGSTTSPYTVSALIMAGNNDRYM